MSEENFRAAVHMLKWLMPTFPPPLRLGFPRLHVAIPNQNIALHFWYPANTLKGKVTVCLDFHFEMKNAMPGLSVCS